MGYQSESNLLHHYNGNVDYFSPIKTAEGFKLFMLAFDLHVNLDSGMKVLDIGCGDGRLTKHWKENKTITGVDFSPNRIRKAKEDNAPGSVFYTMDIYEFLRQEYGQYDLGVLIEVLEHLQNPRELIMLAKKCCRRIIATVPLNYPYSAHLQVYRDSDDVRRQLNPDKVLFGRGFVNHALLEWNGSS